MQSITNIYHWTATIRNLRTFQITELDVDQEDCAMMDDAHLNSELLLFKYIHCVIPEETSTGHYTLDFVLWYLREGSVVLEPVHAASSRVFEVIAKADAPLDTLSEFPLPWFILRCFLAHLPPFPMPYANLG